MDTMTIGLIAGAGLVMFAAGWYLAQMLGQTRISEIKKKVENMLREARREAENIRKEAQLRTKEKWQQLKLKVNAEVQEREKRLKSFEQRIGSREADLRTKMEEVLEHEHKLKLREKELADAEAVYNQKVQQVERVIDEQMDKLQHITGLSPDEAKRQYLDSISQRAQKEAAELMLKIKNEAKARATFEAKWIISDAIQRISSDHTSETTIVTVDLPNEKIKGAVIGREGRNIKAFEQITGIKVIIDDTPGVLVLSGFDPVKREIARLAMAKLVSNPNIQPEYVNKVVENAQKQVEKEMNKASDKVISDLNLKNIPPEVKQLLGKLHYRTSYGQNVLQHSKEVALLAGSLAAELGYDVHLARRAGLLHDIGKALTGEMEGSHVALGVEITERNNEHEVVVNSVLAHHDEAAPIHPISQLVTAADIISGSRPGARRESLEAYSAKIEQLEQIAHQFEGVDKVYAIYAGREIRIVVESEKIDDAEAAMLSSNVAQKIQAEMQYPGQIKVVVIRERRVTRMTNSSTPTSDQPKVVEKIEGD